MAISTPVFLPGKFHGQRRLAVYSPWGQLDMIEHRHSHTHPAPRAAFSSSFRLVSSYWPPSEMSKLHTSSIITPNTTNSKLKLY